MRGAPAFETKRLHLPRQAGAAGAIEGYASLFGVVDLSGDLVERGAFAHSLRRRGTAIRMLFQHDPSEPIGIWTEIAEDARGLHARGTLNLAVGRAREVAALLAQGAIDGLSIGFKTVRARKTGGVRRLAEIDLWEISVVTFPMLPDARVEAQKSMRLPGPHRRRRTSSQAISPALMPGPDSGIQWTRQSRLLDGRVSARP